jgi:copper(I)-binding protein
MLNRTRIALDLIGVAMALTFLNSALAHGTSVGSLRIAHPYAMPDPANANQWLLYFRGIRNEGGAADRLVGARSPVANEVVLQRVVPPGSSQVQAVSAIAFAPNITTPMRHNLGEYRLLLKDLKQTLKDGDRIDVTLTFEQAGSETVKVYLQTEQKPEPEEHKH